MIKKIYVKLYDEDDESIKDKLVDKKSLIERLRLIEAKATKESQEREASEEQEIADYLKKMAQFMTTQNLELISRKLLPKQTPIGTLR